MADISDVEQALMEAITSILYPGGSAQASIIGAVCRIYRGWPNSATLNTDLTAQAVNITVSTDNDSGRTTTRYLPRWQMVAGQPGVVASASGQIVTISGNPTLGDVVGLMIDGVPFAYRIQSGDATDLVAANLAQMISAARLATLYGTTVTIPGAQTIVVRVVCDASSSLESRRQEKDMRIISWCPTPAVRDSVVAAIDNAMNQTSFLLLSDSTRARITYRNTASYDQSQNALLYRRDLIYTAEYPTVTVVQLPSMLFGASDLNTNITYG